MQLEPLLQRVRGARALTGKADIQPVARQLTSCGPGSARNNGDDAAVIPAARGYDLLAAEGFIPEFVQTDPWFAGWCGLMVNISDIAAMGGRPVAVVDTLWGRDDDTTRALLRGMTDAANRFQVPIVGGHTNLHCAQPHLGVAILGRAQRVLHSHQARPGHALVAAIDLRGSYRPPWRNWNAATAAPAERLRADLELLPAIAEAGLAHAAKDISQAGLLGTAVMLLESAGAGAVIRLEQIPRPTGVDWYDWLLTFPSFGYLLSAEAQHLPQLLSRFQRRGIAAATIGEITHSKQLQVQFENQQARFWDLNRQSLTGFGPDARPASPATDECHTRAAATNPEETPIHA